MQEQSDLAAVAAKYRVAITDEMEALLHDPAIAAQFLPDVRELHMQEDELADPIGDSAQSPLPGLVHRYRDRVLLMPLTLCPVYCRFCFRRESVGHQGGPLPEADLTRALDYIADHREIWEVILTGGDPLILSPRRLHRITQALAGMEHVKILRLHSRVPLVDPAKITPARLKPLQEARQTVWISIHANAAGEFTPAGEAALARIADSGIPMIGQSVLLAGVNDSAAQLEALFRAMVVNRIKPYYLHQLDPAPGTSHFRVSLTQGKALLRTLRGSVSGLCQPHYMQDQPDGSGKRVISPDEKL